jgi:hypothetical protein
MARASTCRGRSSVTVKLSSKGPNPMTGPAMISRWSMHAAAPGCEQGMVFYASHCREEPVGTIGERRLFLVTRHVTLSLRLVAMIRLAYPHMSRARWLHGVKVIWTNPATGPGAPGSFVSSDRLLSGAPDSATDRQRAPITAAKIPRQGSGSWLQQTILPIARVRRIGAPERHRDRARHQNRA